jgi:hypothetical protein
MLDTRIYEEKVNYSKKLSVISLRNHSEVILILKIKEVLTITFEYKPPFEKSVQK